MGFLGYHIYNKFDFLSQKKYIHRQPDFRQNLRTLTYGCQQSLELPKNFDKGIGRTFLGEILHAETLISLSLIWIS